MSVVSRSHPLRIGSRVAAAVAIGLALVACQQAPGGEGSDGETVSVFDLEVGDCWTGATDDVLEVEVMPCDQPHVFEVYTLVDYTDGGDEYPGETAIQGFSESVCLDAFSAYVGTDYETSEFFYFPLVPSESTWAAGDREVVCNLTVEDRSEWTGSGRDSGR